MTPKTTTAAPTTTLSSEDIALIRDALESEIEHINDYVKESDDQDEIRNMRIRQDRMEALWRTL